MSRPLFIAVCIGLAWVPLQAQADSQLSPQRLDLLDERGYFTPEFKTAIHHLVDAREAVSARSDAEAQLKATLPDLAKRSAEATAQAAALRETLALYTHPEVSDLETLEDAMKNPAIAPEQRLALAQAFVWAYPTDPHQTEAVQDLQQVQKQLNDRREAAKAAELSQAAARALLLRRVKAHALSLQEWKDFLRDMSQEDLLTYLGRPQSQGNGYWIYTGAWTSDPVTNRKSGLLINFNGTRAIDVEASPY